MESDNVGIKENNLMLRCIYEGNQPDAQVKFALMIPTENITVVHEAVL